MKKTPPNTDYSLTDFLPGNIGRALQDDFGIRPILQKSGNKSHSKGEVEDTPVQIPRSLADYTRSKPPDHEEEPNDDMIGKKGRKEKKTSKKKIKVKYIQRKTDS